MVMAQVTFDLDVLRTFVAGIELGSFAKAATRLGRSTSAVSAQLRKLEEQAGTVLLRKAGRGLALTDAGETMLAYARRLLELNDEAAGAMRALDLEGWVRLGIQEDFAGWLLPRVLTRFKRWQPRVRIEARVARGYDLIERIASARLDLALIWGDGAASPHVQRLAEVPMQWIGVKRKRWRPSEREPLPLLMFEAPCAFRAAATERLDRAGIPWRIALTSASITGLWAAAAAGVGVFVRTALGLPPSLALLSPEKAGLPRLPALALSLQRAERVPSAPAAKLAEIIARAIAPELDAAM
jgi:DNA-binding transcriptional LysR family regulator